MLRAPCDRIDREGLLEIVVAHQRHFVVIERRQLLRPGSGVLVFQHGRSRSEQIKPPENALEEMLFQRLTAQPELPHRVEIQILLAASRCLARPAEQRLLRVGEHEVELEPEALAGLFP